MIEALGSITAGIGRAVSVAPSFGKEVGHAASFVSPKAGVSGGAFSPGLNATGLFSETTPFSASVASVPEMAPANASDIFSGPWQTLGKADIATAPSANVFKGSSFAPFNPGIVSVPERPLKVNFSGDEWLSLAERPKEVESTLGSISVAQHGEAVEGITDLQTEGLKTLTESSIADERVQILAEETIEQDKLAEKVVSLFVKEGVYSEAQARKRVGKIVLERKGLSEESVGEVAVEIKTEAEGKAEFLTETSAKRAKLGTQKTQVKTEDEDKQTEKESLIKKPPRQAPVVDEKAQASRKKEVKGKISSLFNKARKFGLGKINSVEITSDLEKNRENRSLLLRQLLYPLLPDGSLEEAAETVGSLGEITDISKTAEQSVGEWIEEVLDKNVPVRLSKEKSKQVSGKDVKRVLKYLQPESIAV
jgi:hypothetical protein